MPSLPRRALLACAATLAVLPAMAQSSWPEKPVRLVVPYAPGGTTDYAARQIAQKLSEQTGKSFYVENKAGASGTIGSDMVAKAQPDGSSFLVNDTTYAMLPAPVQEAAVGPRERTGAGDDHRRCAAGAGGRRRLAVQDGAGPGRCGAQESRQAHLRLGRRRQLDAPGRRALQAARQARPHARAVQGRGRGDAGRACRARSTCWSPRRPPRSRRSRAARCARCWSRRRSASMRCPTCRPAARPA